MTIKQRLFIKYYLEYGNASEAAMRVYNVKKRETATQIGYENLRKPEIKASIQEYFTHETLDLVSIVKAFDDVLENGTMSQKLKASVTYFKIMGLYPCPHN